MAKWSLEDLISAFELVLRRLVSLSKLMATRLFATRAMELLKVSAC